MEMVDVALREQRKRRRGKEKAPIRKEAEAVGGGQEGKYRPSRAAGLHVDWARRGEEGLSG